MRKYYDDTSASVDLLEPITYGIYIEACSTKKLLTKWMDEEKKYHIASKSGYQNGKHEQLKKCIDQLKRAIDYDEKEKNNG